MIYLNCKERRRWNRSVITGFINSKKRKILQNCEIFKNYDFFQKEKILSSSERQKKTREKHIWMKVCKKRIFNFVFKEEIYFKYAHKPLNWFVI